MDISKLPPEVWREILLRVPETDLPAAERVCKVFRDIVHDLFNKFSNEPRIKQILTVKTFREWDPSLAYGSNVRGKPKDVQNRLDRARDRGVLVFEALKKQRTDVVRILIECGFSTHLILGEAVRSESLPLVTAALDNGAAPSPELLEGACDAFRLDLVDALLLAGADPKGLSLHKGMYASAQQKGLPLGEYGRRQALAGSLTYLQRIAFRRDGRAGLLHITAEFGCDSRLIALFVRHGCQVNGKNEYGATPLIVALANGHLKSADALIEAGADPEMASDAGITPQMIRERTAT